MGSISSSLSWIQPESKVMRRITNNALSVFLKLLRFPWMPTVLKIFSSSNCMEVQGGGRTRWNGTVMFGTSTGILETFPIFERDTETLQAMKRISEYEYNVRTAETEGVY